MDSGLLILSEAVVTILGVLSVAGCAPKLTNTQRVDVLNVANVTLSHY